MKKITFIALLIMSFHYSIAQTLDQDYYTALTSDTSFIIKSTDNDVGQSFTAGLTGNLTSIKVEIEVFNFGCSVGDATVVQMELQAGDGFGGSVLGTSSNITLSDGYGTTLTEFIFPTPIAVVSGAMYTFEVKKISEDCQSLNTALRAVDNGTYTNGTSYFGGTAFTQDLMFQTFVSVAGPEFITTWKTDNPGTSNNTSITIPTNPAFTYSYNVDWGDGTTDTTVYTGNATHSYATANTYPVAITGTFPSIYFNDSGDKQKILSIEQWGTQQWASMAKSFNGCSNLVSYATDTANTSAVTNMSEAFYSATNFNGNISEWDVSNVTNMDGMFYNASSFNQPLNWNVGNVTEMVSMFGYASSFNQNIGNWDVSKVTNMSSMFSFTNFNQDISSWNVSNVTNMSFMFYYNTVFNQPIGSWLVDKVTDMSRMFMLASSFNQIINSWNVDMVTNMNYMFYAASVFNQPLNLWKVGNVTDMQYMFSAASNFNQDIGGWNVEKVTNMEGMFYNTFFNQNINLWNVGEVTNMRRMFGNNNNFNQPIDNWNVSKVTNMEVMFDGASIFNADISNWKVSNVINFNKMFRTAVNFNQNLSTWDISSATVMTDMFYSAGLSISNYDNTLIGWNTLSVTEAQIPTNITFDGGSSKYCNGETARDNLTTTHGWTITDGGLDCSTLGVDDFDSVNISLFPNPVKSSFTVKGLDNGVYSLQIVNLQGQVVKEVSNYNKQPVAIDALASGIYFVNINSNLAKRTIKIIKQ